MKTQHGKIIATLLTAGIAALSTPASAVEAYGVDWSGSGFLTLAAGRVFGGQPNDPASPSYNNFNSPLFLADFGQAGIYEKNQGWTMAPDSKLGLQGTAKFNSQLSVTGQVVTRGAAKLNTNLEWLYVTYKVTDALELQVGRKRLPLFYYSESQDVGMSLPWVRLPSAAYGWDVVNFNGANLRYRTQWGEWSSAIELFHGDEKRSDNPYLKIYYGKHSKSNEKWSNITGGDITLSRDWFESRFMAMQSDWECWDAFSAARNCAKAKQKFYSATFNADYEDWVVRSEFSYVNRRTTDENDFAQLLAVGRQFGKWLPMFTVARFEGNYIDGPLYAETDSERWTNYALSLRYDLTLSSALKVQYDYWKDRNGSTFNGGTNHSEGRGNPRLLSVSYDLMF